MSLWRGHVSTNSRAVDDRRHGRRLRVPAAGHGTSGGVGRSTGRRAPRSELGAAAHAVGPPRPARDLDDGRHARRAAAARRGIRHAAVSDRRGVRRTRDAARRRARHAGPRRGGHVPQRGRHAHVRLHVAGHRSAGRPHPARARGGARAALDAGLVRPRAVQHDGRTSASTTAASRAASIGSFSPAVYGNGARIVQTPDTVVISYEMVHDTRDHSARRPPGLEQRHPPVHGRLARPLRGRHARHRERELHATRRRSAACVTASSCD